MTSFIEFNRLGLERPDDKFHFMSLVVMISLAMRETGVQQDNTISQNTHTNRKQQRKKNEGKKANFS